MTAPSSEVPLDPADWSDEDMLRISLQQMVASEQISQERADAVHYKFSTPIPEDTEDHASVVAITIDGDAWGYNLLSGGDAIAHSEDSDLLDYLELLMEKILYITPDENDT
tara:strand:- start:371 stop:703 length:333 start_codon:yes stop_codon:yes gene_type:complete